MNRPLANCVLLLSMVIATLFCAPARGEGAFEWTYRYLAVTATTDEALFAAVGGIARTPAMHTRETHDLLAQRLVELAPRYKDWKNSGPNIARLLIDCNEASRYHTVLKSVQSRFIAPGSRAAYTKRLLSLGREKGEQYLPGSFDLDAIRDEYARAALAVSPTMKQAQALADLPEDATIEDLFEVAGTPAHVVLHDVKISDIVYVNLREIWFYYRGIGRMAFKYQRETGWSGHYLIAEPTTFEAWMPYRARAQELGLPSVEQLAMAQLLSGNPSAIKVSAQAMFRVDETPQEYLDAAAEVLLRDYAKVANTRAVDAYAWVCSLLADRGGQRYARVLATVKVNTQDEKLRRYADKLVTDRGPEGSFARGAISLEALQAKYPPLYPQITLVHGLL